MTENDLARLPRAIFPRLRGLFCIGLLAVAACGGWEPPAAPGAGTPIPPGPDWRPARKGAKADDASPRARFSRLKNRILDQWLVDDPSTGRQLGLHDFDGRIADYQAASIEQRLERVKRQRQELAAIDRKALPPDDQLDLAILEKEADLLLFKMVDLSEWKKRPQFYEELFSVNVYLDRDYAPIEERARKLHQHEKAALAQVEHVRKNLASPLSKPVVETAIKIFKGYAEYLQKDVVKQLKGVGTPAFQEELLKTNAELAKAAADVAAHLEKVELPKGNDSHILGLERFKKLLQVQEGLTIPIAEFKRMGEENLQANKKAFEKVAQKAVLKRPKATDLLPEATRMMEASRKFVLEKKIVTIPSEERAVLKETPPFMRWNSAFLDAPGPFEPRATNAFYYITMPDPTWKKKEQEEYVMALGILLSTTVHEVYPGHFVQGQWVKRAPTRVQKVLASYSFVEGWAHYTEQMMIEEGFGADDPQNHLGQLSDALLRNCRFVVSLGVHAEGMSLRQAENRFMNDCKQDRATAREQAVRATFDPGYFAYTLGKIQILALRDEAKKKLGAKFSLQRFHDALLGHGAPAIPLIRERVLNELAEQAK
jgi:uncharacterized protein (DUF885 family)